MGFAIVSCAQRFPAFWGWDLWVFLVCFTTGFLFSIEGFSLVVGSRNRRSVAFVFAFIEMLVCGVLGVILSLRFYCILIGSFCELF